MLAIFGPIYAGILATLARGWRQPIAWVVSVGVFGVLSPVLWLAALRPLLVDRLWRLPRTWYEAGFAVAALYLFFAAFEFATGWTPTKYGSHPIPRAHGFFWVWRASVPLLIALGFYAVEKRRARSA